jgi:hypothetical protein
MGLLPLEQSASVRPRQRLRRGDHPFMPPQRNPGLPLHPPAITGRRGLPVNKIALKSRIILASGHSGVLWLA